MDGSRMKGHDVAGFPAAPLLPLPPNGERRGTPPLNVMTPTQIIDGLEHAKTHLLMFDGWSRKDIDAIRHAIAYIRTGEQQ